MKKPDRAWNFKTSVYDTVFLLSNNRIQTSKYRKVHLYDAMGFRESTKLAAGSFYVTKVLPNQHSKTGMILCYDLRFPDMITLFSFCRTSQIGSDCSICME